VKRGQKLLLVHGLTDEAREARVVYIKNGGRGKKRVGIEFISTKGDFWHVFTPVVELKRPSAGAA
jgi:hypothetical protein